MDDSLAPIPPKPDDEYIAANHHKMITTEWKWNGRRGEWVRIQWNAEHSPNCSCGGLEPLPDW